ncbi:MAG: histidine kinase [Clostridiales bacterium]|nr:histidine kinase [Clostridiales bacterium]
MSELSSVTLWWKIISLAFSFSYILIENQDITRVIVITLVLLCLFTIQYFLNYRGMIIKSHSKERFQCIERVDILLTMGEVLIIFFCDVPELASCELVLILSLICNVIDDKMFYCIGGIVVFLYVNTEELDTILILVSMIVIIGYMTHLHVYKKWIFYRKETLRQRQELIDLEDKLKDNERLMKTIRYAASLEERNRMAVRLHDKIGHNISGTILMLEASLLQMEKNPEKAIGEINKAVEHLRDGVDDLRHALREERPVRSDINTNDIKLLLEQTQMEHGLHTVFKTDGDLERISMELWGCIQENITELLTNCLKHSKATAFTVHIKVLPSLIQVIYSDNGSCSPDFKKGLGLEAVEERTLNLKGRCSFEAGKSGFRVTNIFHL